MHEYACAFIAAAVILGGIPSATLCHRSVYQSIAAGPSLAGHTRRPSWGSNPIKKVDIKCESYSHSVVKVDIMPLEYGLSSCICRNYGLFHSITVNPVIYFVRQPLSFAPWTRFFFDFDPWTCIRFFDEYLGCVQG